MTRDEAIVYWREQLDALAVCHCGDSITHSGWDGHAPVWMPCPDTLWIRQILDALTLDALTLDLVGKA